MDFLIALSVSLGLMVATIAPGTVSIVRDMLALKEGQYSRLIAILIVSSLALWPFVLYQGYKRAQFSQQIEKWMQWGFEREFESKYPSVKKLERIAVVIAAYNEEENIAPVLGQMPETICGEPYSILLVDDGSRDRTAQVAHEAGALVVQVPVNRGGGAALRTGFNLARNRGAEVVVTLDADGQHVPGEIPRLVEALNGGEYDLVIGSRILGTREKDSVVRFVGIHVFNRIIQFLTSLPITDCSSGFRAFRLSALDGISLRQDQFHTAELIIAAAKNGVRVGEVPITILKRLSGTSKKGRNFGYGLRFARTIWMTWWT